MTAVILGTVAVVFVLGVMSLGGLPKNTTPEAEQVTLDSALTICERGRITASTMLIHNALTNDGIHCIA